MSDCYVEFTTVEDGRLTITKWRPDPYLGNCIRCNAGLKIMRVDFLCDVCRSADLAKLPQPVHAVEIAIASDEIEAIEWAAGMIDDVNRGDPERSAILRGLISRITGVGRADE